MKKQKHKSKAEILADLKKNKDFMEKMKFTKEVFFPALCKASQSIDDATSFLSSISTILMEIFLASMKERKLGELNLVSKLDSKGERYEELKEMMGLFDDYTIFDAKQMFEGMRAEIALFCNEEMKERKLETLKTKWVDEYLTK